MKLTKTQILDFLKQHQLMTIATQGPEHPWIASVYYSFDNDLNLYFLSNPKTLHCTHIHHNHQVAVSIADSHQKASDLKKGLQIYGHAKQITQAKLIQHAIRHWKQALNFKDPHLTYENMINKTISGRMYIVTPQKIKFFNQELFDVADGEEPVLEL